jgi:hypothetical protein
MRNNQFANVCLALIVILLGVIAFRIDITPAYAAKKVAYEVIRVDEGTIVPQFMKETQAGWEPVAATMWIADARNAAQGFVIFKK